jgi:hypothetical protein
MIIYVSLQLAAAYELIEDIKEKRGASKRNLVQCAQSLNFGLFILRRGWRWWGMGIREF